MGTGSARREEVRLAVVLVIVAVLAVSWVAVQLIYPRLHR
jgi:hypothetical protein